MPMTGLPRVAKESKRSQPLQKQEDERKMSDVTPPAESVDRME